MSGARPLGPQRSGHASLTGSGRSEVREPGIEVVPVKRYWPGKAPAWAVGQPNEPSRPAGALAGASEVRPPAACASGAEQPRERFAGAVVARAQPPQAEVEEEEEEDEDIDARRERARARARALAAEEEVEGDAARTQLRPTAGPDASADSESEYETDTGSDDESGEDAQPVGRVLLKPVFVPKMSRLTVNAQRAAEEAEEEAERRRIERLAERRKETLELVVESARREAEGADAGEGAEMPDDADDEDDLAEYEAWKLREIKRVSAERERKAAAERERAEVERRRGLSEEERLREDAERLRERQQAEEKEGVKRGFLQKYYHKGAFFQAEDSSGKPMLGDIMKRDFGEATGSDRGIDKSALPKPMQVKKFGFRSQVKWTHLSAEDTTNREDILQARDRMKGGGLGQGAPRRDSALDSRAGAFERPSGKRPRT